MDLVFVSCQLLHVVPKFYYSMKKKEKYLFGYSFCLGAM